MLRDLHAISIEVENFALVTHRVPAARVRRHLPDKYKLQTFDLDGTEFCFVTATCFCNRDFRVTALPYPRFTFNENTYRTYIEFKGRTSVYFFARFLERSVPRLPQAVIDRGAVAADFDVTIDRNGSGYEGYTCRATSKVGDMEFSISALEPPQALPPFGSGEEHAQFLTYRLDGYFTSTAGVQAHSPVKHDRMDPWSGSLHSARFDVWDELGIVPRDEAADAYSVLVQPSRHFFLYPPRPAL